MISDDDIIEFVADAEAPVVSSSEVADEFGFSVQGMSKRLSELVDGGQLERKKIGASYAYWIPDD